jgi:hypothetical protein
MSRCASFWHKFEQEGNFCGMDPSEISRVKSYLEFVGKLEKTGLEKDFIFTHFSSGAARPLMNLDDETKLKGINYVAAALKRDEKVTAGELKSSISVWLKQDGKVCSTHARSEKLTNVKKEDQTEPEIEKEDQTEKPPIEPTQPLKVDDKKEDPPEVVTPTKRDAPCMHGHDCPDGQRHMSFSDPKVRNFKTAKCALWDKFCTQLPFNECWLDAKAKRDAEREKEGSLFSTGATINKPPQSIQEFPKRDTKSKLMPEERNAYSDALIERTNFTKKDIEQIDELVDANYDGCASRYELIEKAVMQLLAKAEGM